MANTRNLISHVGWLISPTRKIIDYWKARGDREFRGKALRCWSLSLFAMEVVGCIALMALKNGVPLDSCSLFGSLLIIYAYSRICEVAYAFYKDPLSQAKDSDLKVRDRLVMAMRSYFGLAFNFAALFYFIPVANLFKVGDQCHLASFLEAFYFSGVTLATLGYGDVTPIHWLSRLLAVSEVFIGILIIAIAIATYVGGMNDGDG